MPAGDVPVKQRECEACQACCGPTLQINDARLVVPKNETCRHLCAQGCSLWGTPAMPGLCRTYTCNYLVEPIALSHAERPDQVGAIIQRRHEKGTLLAEYAAGGLARILSNAVWGPLIAGDLRRGEPLLALFLDDPHGAETIHVRWAEGRLGCELASCAEDGKPILVAVEPVHERKLYAALFLANQGFAFDARVLIRYLGGRQAAILAPSRVGGDAPQVRFRITRRQVMLLDTMLGMLEPRGAG